MKQKIKKIIFAFISMTLLLPFTASAYWSVGSLRGYGLPEGHVKSIVERVTQWIMGIVGFICIIGFAIAGILYFTAAGSEDQAKKAKRAMLYSILGILVTLSAWVISMAVWSALNGTTKDF